MKSTMARKYHSVDKRNKAFRMYLDGEQLKVIAKEMNVAYGTVHNWHATYNWAAQRKKMLSDQTDRIDLLEERIRKLEGHIFGMKFVEMMKGAMRHE